MRSALARARTVYMGQPKALSALYHPFGGNANAGTTLDMLYLLLMRQDP